MTRRVAFLKDYQDSAYAERYEQRVARVREVETGIRPESTELAEAVARNYFKLLAYKDEYEVARLYTETGYFEKLQSEYQGRLKPRFHFSPPWIAGIDPNSGRPRKYEYGSWILVVLRVLAKFRFLRGTALDIFSYTKERRLERQLIDDYEAMLAGVCEHLDERHLAAAIELASLPDQIRGYGPIKEAAVETAGERRKEILDAWNELRVVTVS